MAFSIHGPNNLVWSTRRIQLGAAGVCTRLDIQQDPTAPILVVMLATEGVAVRVSAYEAGEGAQLAVAAYTVIPARQALRIPVFDRSGSANRDNLTRLYVASDGANAWLSIAAEYAEVGGT